ncbi:MAG: LytR C-terminal domain-containing protein, partial [bacterium]|nr:LytR C-terminal domain-containing protein [bacterium]
MKKKNDRILSNTKIAVIFFVILLFFVSLSLVFKLVLVIRAGQFDDSKRFNLTISNNKNLEVMSLASIAKTIAVFKLDRNIGSKEAGRFLKVPIEGFMQCNCLDLNQKPDSLFLKAILNYKKVQTNLTIIDLVKLLVFSKKVTPGEITTKNISGDLIPSELDKIVGRLVSDELIEKDNQTIQIINGTDIIGLGNRLARLVTNMGGDVIILATSDSTKKESVISYIDQKTY